MLLGGRRGYPHLAAEALPAYLYAHPDIDERLAPGQEFVDEHPLVAPTVDADKNEIGILQFVHVGFGEVLAVSVHAAVHS